MTTTKIDFTALISRGDVQKHYPMLTKKRLEKLASQGIGPKYIKCSGKTWYTRADIEAYLAISFIEPDFAARQKRHAARMVLDDAHRPLPRKKAKQKLQSKTDFPVPKPNPFRRKPAV